jgi:hypothetical protein
MMVSAWWALAAFLLGIYGGIGLMALLYVVSKSSDEAEHLPDIAPPSWLWIRRAQTAPPLRVRAVVRRFTGLAGHERARRSPIRARPRSPR